MWFWLSLAAGVWLGLIILILAVFYGLARTTDGDELPDSAMPIRWGKSRKGVRPQHEDEQDRAAGQ
jgi:hypothetical protein